MTVRVMRSGVIDAPAAAVWHLLRDFNGHGGWHPAIAASQIEAGEPGDLVGAVRAFTLQDGSFLREQLIALSDREMSLTYCLLDTPIPLKGYVARLLLRPITDGDRCFLLWESSFTPPLGQAAALTRLVAENIYEAGIAALQRHFGGTPIGVSEVSSTSTPASTAVEHVMRSPMSRGAAVPPAPAMQRAEDAMLAAAAIRVDRYGGPEVMQLTEVMVPPPGPGEIRLQQTVIGVNFIDIYCRRGDFNLLQLPGVPGMEAAGTILDLGAGVVDLAVGDRVAYAGPPIGAYAAIRNVPADLVVRIPPDLDDRTVAAAYLKGVTADFLLQDVHPHIANETVLLRAAAGGLGLILSQVLKQAGARVIGVVSSSSKAEAAFQAGCDEVLVQAGAAPLVSQIQALTGGVGVNVIFDGGGGTTFADSFDCLALRGHLISLGQASGAIGARDIDQLVSKSATLSRPNFAHYNLDPATRRVRADRLFAILRNGQVKIWPATVLPLAAAAEAHRGLEDRANTGGYLLLP